MLSLSRVLHFQPSRTQHFHLHVSDFAWSIVTRSKEVWKRDQVIGIVTYCLLSIVPLTSVHCAYNLPNYQSAYHLPILYLLAACYLLLPTMRILNITPSFNLCIFLVSLSVRVGNSQEEELSIYENYSTPQCPQFRVFDVSNPASPQYDAPNGCRCLDGMQGIHCSYCEADAPCQASYDESYVCRQDTLFADGDTYKIIFDSGNIFSQRQSGPGYRSAGRERDHDSLRWR